MCERFYTFDRVASDNVTRFWRCEKKGDGCKGRVHESNGIITKVQRQYTHPPNPGRIEAMACVTSMKRRVVDTRDVFWVTLTGLHIICE